MADWSVLAKKSEDVQAQMQSSTKESLLNKIRNSQSQTSSKLTFLICGTKGVGKTSSAFSIIGDDPTLCISFDKKSQIIKDEFFPEKKNIIVFDALERYSPDPADLSSATLVDVDTKQILNEVIENNKNGENPIDWIIIDNLEVFEQIAEKIMRYNHGLTISSGVNISYWKDRNIIIDYIHNLATQAARKGIIYTTYMVIDRDTQEIRDRETIFQKSVPKWVGDIEKHTDIVLNATSEKIKSGNAETLKFYLFVISSKSKKIKTGEKIDITNLQGKKLFLV